MCGIAGFFDFSINSSEEILKSMVTTMHHRGPDDSGTEFFFEKNCQIGLGHARLSIIDLSFGGHQPMSYNSYTIVFNGEIYNYREIRKELEELGHTFKTSTDTEVILHSFERWGTASIAKYIGMFAFVIYDRNFKKAIIVRDRAGVKPLYYFFNNGLFIFGSELKSLMAHPKFEKEINTSALPHYFQYGYISAPYTIFKNTQKVMPGHFLTVDIGNQSINTECYWNIVDFYTKPKLNLDYQEAKSEVKRLMESAFSYRMIADVPIGVFLSGGYDSTAVTAMLQSKSSMPLKTFTIGFKEGNNEAPYAREIASFLGTNHTEYICSVQDAKEIIPTLPAIFDEPFGDSSAIPTILVSKLARRLVTVAISADGGDEIFCGYNSYSNLFRYLVKVKNLPISFSKKVLSILRIIENRNVVKSSITFHKIRSAFYANAHSNNHRAAYLFKAMSEKPRGFIEDFFLEKKSFKPINVEIEVENFINEIEVAMAFDFKYYLPNDILTKVDRSTMSVSLEGREPLIDHRLVELVVQLPFNFKYDGKVGKRILKDIVHDFVPQKMVERPKTGFSLPIYSWLRGDLSYLLDEHLSATSLSLSGLFNVTFLTKQIQKFKKNKLHYSPIIWNLLMFQMWWQQWMSRKNK